MQQQYYKKLDGLRALAVFAVMITHWIYLDVVVKLGFGFWGVNLFFVLSGFLITEILLKQQYCNQKRSEILKKFYIKRTLRIFPIYYLVIIFALFLNLDNSRSFAGYTLTYTLNFYNVFTGDIGTSLSHLWSLCVEEQFYLVWPILLLIVKPLNHLKLIIAMIVLAILIRFVFFAVKVPNYSIYNYRMMPACMDALGIGALLAYLKLNKAGLLEQLLKKIYIPFIALCLFIIVVFLLKDTGIISETLFRFFVSVCSFFLIGCSIFKMNNRFGRFLENKVIQYLGRISYGLYLYHFIVSSLLNGWYHNYWDSIATSIPAVLRYNSYLISFPLYLAITIALASLSYYIIEKPFLKLKEKIENKWKQNSNLPSLDVAGSHSGMQSISATPGN